MKKMIWFITYAVILTMVSCEESTEKDLLESLTEGKMVIKVDGVETVLNHCTWMNFGETAMAGEVFVQAIASDTIYEPYCSVMYGSYENAIAMTERTYQTSITDDMMTFFSSFGNTDETHSIKVEIVEISSTVLKGKFSGKINSEENIEKEVEGAFWAIKFEHPTY